MLFFFKIKKNRVGRVRERSCGGSEGIFLLVEKLGRRDNCGRGGEIRGEVALYPLMRCKMKKKCK